MAFTINHLHLKTPDPRQTAQWYVDNLGATIVSDAAPDSYRLDLHGLAMNVSKFSETQTHQQHYGMEHLAINTDDIENVVENMKSSGARVLEEIIGGSGRRVYFIEGPQGVMFEVIESAN